MAEIKRTGVLQTLNFASVGIVAVVCLHLVAAVVSFLLLFLFAIFVAAVVVVIPIADYLCDHVVSCCYICLLLFYCYRPLF